MKGIRRRRGKIVGGRVLGSFAGSFGAGDEGRCPGVPQSRNGGGLVLEFRHEWICEAARVEGPMRRGASGPSGTVKVRVAGVRHSIPPRCMPASGGVRSSDHLGVFGWYVGQAGGFGPWGGCLESSFPPTRPINQIIGPCAAVSPLSSPSSSRRCCAPSPFPRRATSGGSTSRNAHWGTPKTFRCTGRRSKGRGFRIT